MLSAICKSILLPISLISFIKEDNFTVAYKDSLLKLTKPQEIFSMAKEDFKTSLFPLGVTEKFTSNEKYLASLIASNSIQIQEVSTGKILHEQLMDVRFSTIAWEEEGFYYIKRGKREQVYYHRIDTPQTDDVLIYQDLSHPKRIYHTKISQDHKYLTLYMFDKKNCGWGIFVKNLSEMEKPFHVAFCNICL